MPSVSYCLQNLSQVLQQQENEEKWISKIRNTSVVLSKPGCVCVCFVCVYSFVHAKHGSSQFNTRPHYSYSYPHALSLERPYIQICMQFIHAYKNTYKQTLTTAKTYICMNAQVRFGWKIQHTYFLQRIFPPWAPPLSPSLTFGACVCHLLLCPSLVTRTYSDINVSLERQFCFGGGENTPGLQTLRRQLTWHSRTAIAHSDKVCALVTPLCH